MGKKSLKSRVGLPPSNDSLGALSWMQRALAEMASDVIESNLTAAEKRSEMLAIADRMAKLRDPDRIYQAEQMLRGQKARRETPVAGPQLTDAPNVNSGPDRVTARRGRPARSSLR